MEFVDGFEWAVSTSFSNALDQCRFERGDRLYPTPDAYQGVWADVRSRMKRWIQIRSPERTSGSAVLGGGSKFATNWASEVKLTLYENGCEPREVVTTQGRVYTLLWQDDIGVLDKNRPEPEVPERAVSVLRRIRGGEENLRTLGNGAVAFLMPFDCVSPVSIDKFDRVNSRLSPHLSEGPRFVPATEVALLDGLHLAPTTGLMLFHVGGLSSEGLETELKTELYRPIRDSAADMFRISAHGVIL
jgi:hypothetical protein